MRAPELYWQPDQPGWKEALKSLGPDGDGDIWQRLITLANSRLDFLRTNSLDRAVRLRFNGTSPANLSTRPVRLAVLASATVEHLLPAVRVGGLRRGLWIETYSCAYGQYLQELADRTSGLYRFAPNAVLLAADADLLGATTAALDRAAADAVVESAGEHLRRCWRRAKENFGCQVIQQTILPVSLALIGSNEHRLFGSQRRLVERLNARLRELADGEGVDLLAIDARATEDGIFAWHDPVLWHRGKQEVHPAAAPVYGDIVGRLLAAQQGRSFKCIVLDLDNTLWGGVVGDDGLEGIVLGQGHALGEAYVSFQCYLREQARRGVILAVNSKNDEVNALAPFESHPEMILKRSDIGCFVANWRDKPSNIREIADALNIGLDAMVFVDDNPFERNIVRRELPTVAVPELPEDPSLYARTLADAGYFEALHITEEDLLRTQLYQAQLQRDSMKAASTDVAGYLQSLHMKMLWRPFDRIGLQRIVQLINKTNQFNLTTRRYTEEEVLAVMADALALTLQIRLVDQFGDNGIVGIVMGHIDDSERDMVIDTWLMSCRVLGRQVEEATLNLVAERSRRLGAARVIGAYRPSAKNAMVREHYPKLGFQPCGSDEDGRTYWSLSLDAFVPRDTFIAMEEA